MNLIEVVIYVNSDAVELPTAERDALIQPISEQHSPLKPLDTGHIVAAGQAFTSDVYAGVFNYLHPDELIQFLERIPWDDETSVAAVINDENDLLRTWRRRSNGTWTQLPPGPGPVQA